MLIVSIGFFLFKQIIRAEKVNCSRRLGTIFLLLSEMQIQRSRLEFLGDEHCRGTHEENAYVRT